MTEGPNLRLWLQIEAAARAELAGRGVEVSEVQDFPWGRFVFFQDPDGNGWLFQEIKERLPGREWKLSQERNMDVASLAELLSETEEHHGNYEKTHPKHNWWDWYAPYLSARQNGSSPEEAVTVADRYMEIRKSGSQPSGEVDSR